MILNCKVCGGSLKIVDNTSICKCEYCGKEQTLPKTDDEQVINMLNRANHFRQIFEFDKAIEIYERLLESGNEDAELYWSLTLCRYGIEYVDDPLTKEKIPTCHRTQYKSILEDADYLMAIKCADSYQQGCYSKEAHYIDQVQKDILEISNKEDPFDVFICYKESDGNGNRTSDSVLAQEIYYQLTEKNYKVFFARITLENKVGQQYEPYIFAALNSAKVMIVVGTKPEYFNAVWVKNEWNRYLAILHNDKSRLIIPTYKDMDPYDLPDALSYYQALDMSKIGFVQDLIRGIEKVLSNGSKSMKEAKYSDSEIPASSNLSALLKRGDFALEDGEWEKAFDFFDQVLNMDAENGYAYLGQALSRKHCPSIDELSTNMQEKAKGMVATNPKEYVLSISEERINDIITYAQPYQIDLRGEILNKLKSFKARYSSSVEYMKKYMEENKVSLLGEDKLLQKATRFSDEIKAKVNKVEQEYYEAFEVILRQEEIDTQERKAKAEQEVDECYNQMFELVKGICDRKQQEFEGLRERLYQDNSIQNARAVMQVLAFKFKGFKDADELRTQISEKIAYADKKIRELSAEKSDIMNSEFKKASGINKKAKIAALQERIRKIDQEIEMLSKV